MRYLSALRPSPTCDDRHAREDGRCKWVETWATQGQTRSPIFPPLSNHAPYISSTQPFLKIISTAISLAIYMCGSAKLQGSKEFSQINTIHLLQSSCKEYCNTSRLP